MSLRRKTHIFKTKTIPEKTGIAFIFLQFTLIWGLKTAGRFCRPFLSTFELLFRWSTWKTSRLSRLCRMAGRRRSILIAFPDNGVCFSALKLNRWHSLKNEFQPGFWSHIWGLPVSQCLWKRPKVTCWGKIVLILGVSEKCWGPSRIPEPCLENCSSRPTWPVSMTTTRGQCMGWSYLAVTHRPSHRSMHLSFRWIWHLTLVHISGKNPNQPGIWAPWASQAPLDLLPNRANIIQKNREAQKRLV